MQRFRAVRESSEFEELISLEGVTAPVLPLVSIVTPSFNMARFLPATLGSVFTQDYPRLEYIVMDGGSGDGTLEILEQQASRLRYHSGSDGGPADAIDRGFSQATGEIFAWLNADDTYEPGAVRAAVDYLLQNPDVDVVYGEGAWMDEDGKSIGRYPTRPFDPGWLERDCFICQPAAFMRASAYRRCRLDPALPVSFDYDLWIRMAALGIRFALLPRHLANTRMHRTCITLDQRDQVFRVTIDLLRRHYGYVPMSWVFGYASFRIDGRDQFFQPLRPSLRKYLASLPLGLRYNASRPWRYLAEWAGAPYRFLRRRPDATQ